MMDLKKRVIGLGLMGERRIHQLPDLNNRGLLRGSSFGTIKQPAKQARPTSVSRADMSSI